MGTTLASHSEICAAPPEVCFDAVADFASYPEWQSAVRKATLLEPTVVAFEIDAKVRTIRYTLAYHLERPGRIWWDYVSGDVRSVDGDFTFAAGPAPGTTVATYSLAIDPGVFVPGPVRKLLTGQVMKAVVTELRDRVASP